MNPRKPYTMIVLFLIAMCFANLSQTSAQLSPKDTIKSVLNSIYNVGDISEIDSQFAANFVRHPAETDANALKISALSLRAALPDLKGTIELMLAENNLVAVRLLLRGTFINEFISPNALPIAPNNKVITFSVHLIYRIDEIGKIAEEWDGFDNLSFLNQLGILPTVNAPPTATLAYPDVVDVGMSGQNKQVVQQFYNAVNQNNLSFIDSAFKSDFLAHNPFGSLDRNGFSADLGRLRNALPDLKIDTSQLVTEGNWTAALYTLKGTFSNAYINADGSSINPTGKSLNLPTITFYRFDQQGLIAENFENYDSLSFLTQLGLITVAAPILTPTPTG